MNKVLFIALIAIILGCGQNEAKDPIVRHLEERYNKYTEILNNWDFEAYKQIRSSSIIKSIEEHLRKREIVDGMEELLRKTSRHHHTLEDTNSYVMIQKKA